MPKQPVSINLDRDGKLIDLDELLTLLKGAGTAAVRLDAKDTPILPARHLQVLMAAEKHCQSVGAAFEIENRSAQFDNCLSLLGWQPAQ